MSTNAIRDTDDDFGEDSEDGGGDDRTPPFEDRREAGRVLASALSKRGYAGAPNLLVLALPRGGVPVAFEVAQALRARLDVFLVRKLGVPGQEELALGAVATGGVVVRNEDVVQALGISEEVIAQVAQREGEEMERRARAYRDDLPPPPIEGHTVLLIDDGLATGATMRAAARAVRAQDPFRLAIAVPVAARSVCRELRREADDIVCARTPAPFFAVGYWYRDFSQTTDNEVRDLLVRACAETAETDITP